MKTAVLTFLCLTGLAWCFGQTTGTFTDTRDGKVYKTVVIGTQTWMAENLNFATSSGSMCYENEDFLCDTYGRLYTWKVAKYVCPAGWHLPSSAEWTTLTTYLGGEDVAGEKMRSTNGWENNCNGTNTSGFTALPGGYYCEFLDEDDPAQFNRMRMCGEWWSSSSNTDNKPDKFEVWYYDSKARTRGGHDLRSLSVRCIKD